MTYAWLIFATSLSLILMLMSFFLKTPILPLMCACAWAWVLFNTDYIYLQAVAVLGLIWAGFSLFVRYSTGGYD